LLNGRRLVLGEQLQQTLAAFVIHHLSPPLCRKYFLFGWATSYRKVALSGEKSNEEMPCRQSLIDQRADYLSAADRANARFDQPYD
jgi:hypothetical protein